jgi:HSP20 family protein
MLMRTDPFRELDRLTSSVFGTPARPAPMPIDAFRTGDTFVVELDLPGVNAESIDVSVERNVLTIHATRERHSAEAAELIVSERPFGTFSRQLFLGETLDTERISARYADGVLRLEIPVAEQAKPRKVTVSAAAAAESKAITV